MSGTIVSVEDHGSIVILKFNSEDGGSQTVPMDHRAFGWMAEAEAIESTDDLVGRPVRFDGQTLVFLDAVEAA